MTKRPLTLPLLLLVTIGCRTGAADIAEANKPLPEQERDGVTDGETGGTEEEAEAGGGSVSLTAARDDQSAYRLAEQTLVIEAETSIGPDGNLTGAVSYRMALDGVENCVAEVNLAGTPWAGDCEDCDFAFDLEAEVTEELATAYCGNRYWSTFEEPPPGYYMQDPVLGFWSHMVTPTYTWTYGEPGTDYYSTYTWGGYEYNNVLRAGWTNVWPGYEGPYYPYEATEYFSWTTLAADELSSMYGMSTHLDGDTLSWGMDQAYETYVSEPWATYCGTELNYGLSIEPTLGDAPTFGSLACDNSSTDAVYAMDGWSFSAEAGETVMVSLDTLDAESAFWPYVWVTSPEGCITVYPGYDYSTNTPCTGGPEGYMCPAFKFEAEQTGSYEILVGHYGTCVGTEAAYRLDVIKL